MRSEHLRGSRRRRMGSARAKTTGVGPTRRPCGGTWRTPRRCSCGRTRPGTRLCRPSPVLRRCRPARRPTRSAWGSARRGWSRWLSVRDVVKPSAPGLDALGGERGHRGDVVGGGRLRCAPALAHHVERARAPWGTWAPTSMSWGDSVEGVEVLGEASPTPTSMPSCSAAPGMSSTPSISSMSHSWSSGRTGAKPDAAVAHHDGGDAVPATTA